MTEKRALQRAEQVDEQDQKPTFVPFAGSAKRIDGKAAAATATAQPFGGNVGGGKSTEMQTQPKVYTAPGRKSMVGKKYSKTGSTMSAFGGKGNVLK